MAEAGVLGLFSNFTSDIKKNIGSHTVIVALPLSIITIFCFGYVLVQQPQTLKKDEGTAASKQPPLFTGTALPSINDPSVGNADLDKLPLDTGQSAALTADNTIGSPVAITSNPQAPMATNPQSSATQNIGTTSNPASKKAKEPPSLNVVKPLFQLLDNL